MPLLRCRPSRRSEWPPCNPAIHSFVFCLSEPLSLPCHFTVVVLFVVLCPTKDTAPCQMDNFPHSTRCQCDDSAFFACCCCLSSSNACPPSTSSSSSSLLIHSFIHPPRPSPPNSSLNTSHSETSKRFAGPLSFVLCCLHPRSLCLLKVPNKSKQQNQKRHVCFARHPHQVPQHNLSWRSKAR